jgi:hypothetical protein
VISGKVVTGSGTAHRLKENDMRAGRNSRHRLIGLAAVVTGAVTISLLTIAPAQASWTHPVTLTGYKWQGSAAPVVAVNRYGAAILAWSAVHNNGKGCGYQIQLRIRTRSGRLGPLETLTPCGPSMAFPWAAINDHGFGVVAWVNSLGPVFEARLVSPTGRLGRLIALAPTGSVGGSVEVAMSPSGQALAVWEAIPPSGGSSNIYARFIRANGVLGPLRTLGGGPGQRPNVVMGRNGVATVAWTDDGLGSRAVARRLTPTHVSPLQVIIRPGSNTLVGTPLIADDARGDTVLVDGWDVIHGSRQRQFLGARMWSHSGKLGRLRQLAKNDVEVALATDGAGDSIVSWSSYVTATRSAVFARRVSRTGAVGRVVRLGRGYYPAITVDPAGAGLVDWQSVPVNSNTAPVSQVYARRFSVPTGRFAPQFTLTKNGSYAALGENWAGKFAAIWIRSEPWPIQARFGP